MTSKRAIQSLLILALLPAGAGLIYYLLVFLNTSPPAFVSPNAPPKSSQSTSDARSATENVASAGSPTSKAKLFQGDLIKLQNEVIELVVHKNYDEALNKVNRALQDAPDDPALYELRGNVYGENRLWDQAKANYETALTFGGDTSQLNFNLAEIAFRRGSYDEARSGFVGLAHHSSFDDLATYKIFLCDLLGNHGEAAAQEFDAMNRVQANASYYFANAAWAIHHHQTEEARGWLKSAYQIYSPEKYALYAASLVELGYVPLSRSEK